MSRLFAMLVVVLVLMAPAARAADSDGRRIMLVIDSSAAMAEAVGGDGKLDIARQVLGDIVKARGARDAVGLVAYGASAADTCSALEVLRDPAKPDRAAVLKALKPLVAQGKAPMTEAVRLAAERLDYTHKKSTIVVIAGGIDTCDSDPCAVASDLADHAAGLVIQAVGFGPAASDAAAQLDCLSQKTGGTTQIVQTAADLKSAIARALAATGPPPLVTAGTAGKSAAVTFHGRVEMAPGVGLAPPYEKATWEFHRRNDDGTPGDWLETEFGADISSSLAPGRYIAVVGLDAAHVQVPVTIAAGEVAQVTANLDAGTVSFTATQLLAEGPDAESTSWEIHRASGEYLATKYGPTASFLLDAGDYSVVLGLGSASATKKFRVTAGKDSAVTVPLGAGQIVVQAVLAPGGAAVAPIAFEVDREAVNADGGHDIVASANDSRSRFDLPAGRYLVSAVADDATATQRVTVTAGQSTEVSLNLNAGFLSVKAAGAAEIFVYEARASLTGERRQVAYAEGTELARIFNAGSYHVVALDQQGVALPARDFTVTAGQRTEGEIR